MDGQEEHFISWGGEGLSDEGNSSGMPNTEQNESNSINVSQISPSDGDSNSDTANLPSTSGTEGISLPSYDQAIQMCPIPSSDPGSLPKDPPPQYSGPSPEYTEAQPQGERFHGEGGLTTAEEQERADRVEDQIGRHLILQELFQAMENRDRARTGASHETPPVRLCVRRRRYFNSADWTKRSVCHCCIVVVVIMVALLGLALGIGHLKNDSSSLSGDSSTPSKTLTTHGSMCGSLRCRNGGTCNAYSTYHSYYHCSCTSGFTGVECTETTCPPNFCYNGGTCKKYGDRFSCTCPQGFKGYRCQDKTRCEYNYCHNGGTCYTTLFSWTCSCPTGYTGRRCSIRERELRSSTTTTKQPTVLLPLLIEPYLLFSGENDFIGAAQLDGTNKQEYLAISGKMDIAYEKKGLFISKPRSGGKHDILFVKKENGYLVKEKIVRYRTVDNFAYDWIHNNIYWTDSDNTKIFVTNVKSRHKTTLTQLPLVQKGGIIVDPREDQGWLYYGDGTGIARIGLDGSKLKKTFVDSATKGTLTIDFQSNKLYWVSGDLATDNAIMRVDLDGSNMVIVVQSSDGISSIVHLQGFLYYMSMNSSRNEVNTGIRRVSTDVISTSNFTSFIIPVETILTSSIAANYNDLQIFDSKRQPNGKSVCGENCGGCSFMCLPAPYEIHVSRRRFTCVCPDEQQLNPDGFSCSYLW